MSNKLILRIWHSLVLISCVSNNNSSFCSFTKIGLIFKYFGLIFKACFQKKECNFGKYLIMIVLNKRQDFETLKYLSRGT
ncbi:hypothetical protein FLWE109334_12695 [Flavobacterium weaverense]|uniref:Uncharacterized protein n=1 Tax=Flavobacterium weaverense TaxID=271156 RepID=A0A3L9ZLL5_9FLAO|nr:hypothetical protein BC961_2669 [Flavobacterium weaverense]